MVISEGWNASGISGEERAKLFKNFALGVCRLEMLPEYSVPSEKADLEAFVNGRPLPNPVLGAESWFEGIRASVNAGKYFSKFKIVPKALTPYLRMQLQHLAPASVEYGMDYRIVLAEKAESILAGLKFRQDFWFFDRKAIVLMDYDQTGAYIGARLVDAPEACRHANEVLSQLHAVSMPHEKFMKDIYSSLSSK